MRDVVFSIFFLYVLEHPVPSVIIKVDIDIRHVYTVRVKETLEQEVILYRVYICILRQYATAEPAADPRPGPTEIPSERAAAMKSWTIRK